MDEIRVRQIADNVFKQKQQDDQYGLGFVPSHSHTGVDSAQVDYSNLANPPKPIFYVTISLYNTLPQTSTNFYGIQWIAPVACTVKSIQEMHKDSSSPNALTLGVRKGVSTQLLSSNINLAAVGGDVITNGVLTTTVASLNFAVGDSLQWYVSASVANITGVCVVVQFQTI